MATIHITNEDSVYTEDDIQAYHAEGGGKFIMDADAFLYSKLHSALQLDGPGSWIATINGTLASNDVDGLYLATLITGLSKITPEPGRKEIICGSKTSSLKHATSAASRPLLLRSKLI